jgi:hypothetical protein
MTKSHCLELPKEDEDNSLDKGSVEKGSDEDIDDAEEDYDDIDAKNKGKKEVFLINNKFLSIQFLQILTMI